MEGANYNTVFKDMTCRDCGYQGKPKSNGEINATHGYVLRCPECDLFYGWAGKAKPLKDGDGKRQISSIWPAKRLGVNKCQMCQREGALLGEGETLQVHHVEDVGGGGADDPENIWVVCTPCHIEIHHRRTYFNSHLQKFFLAYTAYQRAKDRGEIQ